MVDAKEIIGHSVMEYVTTYINNILIYSNNLTKY
jgi:hypothetical protein